MTEKWKCSSVEERLHVTDDARHIPAEVKSCKAVTDDKERLKCFDGLFAEPSKSQKSPEEKQGKRPAEEKQATGQSMKPNR
jgi:hypothetical protein